MKLRMTTILTMLFAVFAVTSIWATATRAQNPASSPSAAVVRRDKTAQPVSVTVEDLQTLRLIVAERDSLKREKADLTNERTEWQTSSASWKKNYEKAVYRADVVQEKRIGELNQAIIEKDQALKKANEAVAQLLIQHDEDKNYIGKLEFDKRKLKGDRWKYGLIGTGAGFAAGAYSGYKFAGNKIVITGSSGGLASNAKASFSF